MALDIPGLKKRQEAARANRGNFWKPIEGKNTIRVFTFKHKVTKADIKAGLFGKAQEGKTVEELERIITRQWIDRKPIISTDATIKKWQELKKTKGEQAARDIAPRKAFMLNVVDTGGKEIKMSTWAAPASVFNAIVDLITDEEFGEEMLGRKGRDFVISFKPNASPGEMYNVVPRKEGKSPKLSSELEAQVKDLYSDEEYKTFGSVPADTDEEEDADAEVDEDEDDEEEDGETVDADNDDEDESDDEDDDDDSDESDSDDDSEDEDDDDADDEDDEDDEDEDEDSDDEEPAPKKKLKKKKSK